MWFSIFNSRWRFFGFIIILVITLALPAAWLEELLPPDQDSGTPTTWPPSAMAFIVGMTSFFLVRSNRTLCDKIAMIAIGLAEIMISLLAAITAFDNFGHTKEMSIVLILLSIVVLAVTYRREFLLLGVLLAAAYVIYLSPKWDDDYYLLVSAMLLAWGLFLHQRASTARVLSLSNQSYLQVKQPHVGPDQGPRCPDGPARHMCPRIAP